IEHLLLVVSAELAIGILQCQRPAYGDDPWHSGKNLDFEAHDGDPRHSHSVWLEVKIGQYGVHGSNTDRFDFESSLIPPLPFNETRPTTVGRITRKLRDTGRAAASAVNRRRFVVVAVLADIGLQEPEISCRTVDRD